MGRLGSAKSSGGCITCKIRRVKCDESRPACYRCSRTGRKCDGYVAPSIQIISTHGNRSRAQSQAFSYFVDQVLPGMTRVVDTKFWNRFLLQASHSNNVVWLATTSMSELIRQLQSGNANRQLALQWYTQSIHELQAQIKHEMKWSVACSITAIIYICIECLLDNMSGVILIYQQAMQQISQARNEEVDGSIAPLLRHITAAHGLRLPPRPASTHFAFSSTTDVQDMLSELVGEAHQLIDHVEMHRLIQPKHWQPPADLVDQRNRLLAQLHAWQHALAKSPFSNIAPSPADANPDHPLIYACMQLAYTTYKIWLSAILASEMAFDAHQPQFEAMLAHAKTAIAAMSGPLLSLFSFETRVIPFLNFVATRCRHPHTRRHALQLLLAGPQVENTRTATSVIASAKRIIAVEEAGTTDGVFVEVLSEPRLKLELPGESERLVSAKVEPRVGSGGLVQQVLRFGRWRKRQSGGGDEAEWRVEYETVKV